MMEIKKPVRVERSYRQRIEAAPEDVFPLLCPVRETEWADGWLPRVVFSNSGIAEQDCVFVTEGDGDESVWMITRYDRSGLSLEMLKITPGVTAGKITIALRAIEPDVTEALVSYAFTALAPRGEEFVRGFTESYYNGFMQQWEGEVNGYLRAHRSPRG